MSSELEQIAEKLEGNIVGCLGQDLNWLEISQTPDSDFEIVGSPIAWDGGMVVKFRKNETGEEWVAGAIFMRPSRREVHEGIDEYTVDGKFPVEIGIAPANTDNPLAKLYQELLTTGLKTTDRDQRLLQDGQYLEVTEKLSDAFSDPTVESFDTIAEEQSFVPFNERVPRRAEGESLEDVIARNPEFFFDSLSDQQKGILSPRAIALLEKLATNIFATLADIHVFEERFHADLTYLGANPRRRS